MRSGEENCGSAQPLAVPFSAFFFTKTLADLFNFCLDKGKKGDYNLPVKK